MTFDDVSAWSAFHIVKRRLQVVIHCHAYVIMTTFSAGFCVLGAARDESSGEQDNIGDRRGRFYRLGGSAAAHCTR